MHRLATTITQDAGNLPDDYDDAGSLERTGAIRVTAHNSPDEAFKIELIAFERRQPLLSPPAIINRNIDAVFQIVQKCRQRWETALASPAETVRRADGTTSERV